MEILKTSRTSLLESGIRRLESVGVVGSRHPMTDGCNFVLHGATADAPLPEYPHVACADGFAWHPDPDQRPHWYGQTAAPVRAMRRS